MVVLDTHTAIWWTAGAGLRPRARTAIDDADRVAIPAIGFWEVAILTRRGRLALSTSAAEWARAVLSIPRVTEVPLTAAIALDADALPMHADPADRFLVASARALAAPLVSKDALLRGLGLCRVMW